MEKTQVCVSRSRQVSNELSAVYELITKYRHGVNSEYEQAEGRWYKSALGIVTVSALTIIGGLLAALYFLPPTTWGNSKEEVRLVLQMMVLLSYALGGGVLLFQSISIRRFYKDFTGQLISIAKENNKHDAMLYESLDSLSKNSIQYVANQLEQASEQLGSIRSFLLGAIDKVGIIPGLIATVLAISKVAESTGVSWLELLSYLMLGFYLSMFPIAEASMKIKRLSILLNQYLSLVRPDPELGEEGG